MATLSSNPTRNTCQGQTDWQVEYLRLEAEVDLLLLKLTTMMQHEKPNSLDESSQTPQRNERTQN